MRWRRRFFEVFAVFALGCSGTDVPTPAAGGLTVAYSGNVDGEIEPCG